MLDLCLGRGLLVVLEMAASAVAAEMVQVLDLSPMCHSLGIVRRIR
jgi:hypothetical protein